MHAAGALACRSGVLAVARLDEGSYVTQKAADVSRMILVQRNGLVNDDLYFPAADTPVSPWQDGPAAVDGDRDDRGLCLDGKNETASFEGPFALLLNLVEERKLFINEVSLAIVTEDYLKYIKITRKNLKITHGI